MKFCTKCGEVYPASATYCSADATELSIRTETTIAGQGGFSSAEGEQAEGDLTIVDIALRGEPISHDTSFDAIDMKATGLELKAYAVDDHENQDELVCYDNQEKKSFEGLLIADRYRLGARIGIGGYGVVYGALDVREDQQVAIKLLSPELARDKRALVRFRREAIASMRLNHPGIVAILDFAIGNGEHSYIVMEYLPGKDLEAILAAQGCMAPRRAAALIMNCADALSAAHKDGVLHRDLKPANIFIREEQGREEQVKIIDFGIAKDRSSNPRLRNITAASKVVGTPFYMSPEQACGEELDVRADIYSLGVILFEMLTGLKPFTGNSVLEILMAHGNAVRQAPSQIQPVLIHEQGLDGVVLKAIGVKKEDRYASMNELAADLRSYLYQGLPSFSSWVPSAERQDISPGAMRKFSGHGFNEHSDVIRMSGPPVVVAAKRNRWEIALLILAVMIMLGALYVLS